MTARVVFRIRLGPYVSCQIDGENCREVADALVGFEQVNERIDAMCSDLVERIYPNGPNDPDGVPAESEPREPEL